MKTSHLDAASALALFDTPPEEIFDRLTTIVVKVLKVPVSTMTLIDERRQFFKSSAGLPPHLAEARETPLTHSFCKHVVYQGEPFIVEDSRTNAVVKENPAIQTLGVLAYAGMPVRDENGTAIGSLCAISDRPRVWTKVELETLALLAEQASAEVALRATALRLGQDLAQMQTEDLGGDSALPADDLSRALKIARPETDGSLPHIGLAGDTYTVLLSGRDTNGRYCVIDMHVPPGGGPPPHRHDFEESFTVLAGEIEASFRGEKLTVRAGETISIPANAPHFFTNAASEPARLLCICAPAGQEEFFAQVGVPVASRTTPPPPLSKEEQAAGLKAATELARKYRSEILVP